VAESEAEQLLVEIGHLLMEDKEYPSEPTLLYTEVDHNFTAQSIFKMLGDHILYRWPVNARLTDALVELWETQEKHGRWSELEYILRDGRFEASYIYPDDIDPQEDIFVRGERSVRRHFGEKPIVYPPLMEEEGEGYDF